MQHGYRWRSPIVINVLTLSSGTTRDVSFTNNCWAALGHLLEVTCLFGLML